MVFAELRRIVGSGLGLVLLGIGLLGKVQPYIGRVAIRLGRLLDAIEAGSLKPWGARKAVVRRERPVAEADAVAVEKQPWDLVRIPRRRHWLNHAFSGKIGSVSRDGPMVLIATAAISRGT